MDIKWRVEHQQLKRLDTNIVVAESVDYLKCAFEFTEDWNETTKMAFFVGKDNVAYQSLVGEDNWCYVPKEVILSPRFFINLVGFGNGTNKRITTEVKEIQVSKTGVVIGEVVDMKGLESDTLDIEDLGAGIWKVELKYSYGTKLKFDIPSGTIKMLGTNDEVLSSFEIPKATSEQNGFMSSEQYQQLSSIYKSFNDEDGNNIVDTIKDLLDIFDQYPEGKNILEALENSMTTSNFDKWVANVYEIDLQRIDDKFREIQQAFEQELALKVDNQTFEQFKGENSLDIEQAKVDTLESAKEYTDSELDKQETAFNRLLENKVDNSTYNEKMVEIQGELDSKVEQTEFDTFKENNTNAINQSKQEAISEANEYTESEIETLQVEVDSNRVKLANLYEMLNGYIFESASEEFTELDSAVLPSTISVNDNLYNIADKTRTAITSVKGHTKKASNLLNLQDKEETTVNGITYSIKNGVITLNGTASSSFFIAIGSLDKKLIGKTCSIGGYPANSAAYGYLQIRKIAENDTGAGVKDFTIPAELNESDNPIRVYVVSEKVYNNFIIKPMLVEGSEAPSVFERGYDGLKATTFAGVELTGRNLFLPKDEEEPTVFNGLTSQFIDQHFIIKGTSINAYNVGRTIDIELPAGTYGVRKSSSFGMQVIYEDGTSAYPNIYPTGVMTIAKKTKSIVIYQTIKGNTTYNLDHTLIISKGDAVPVEWLKALKPTVLPFDKIELNGVGTAQDELIVSENESDSFYTLKHIKRVGLTVLNGSESNWSNTSNSRFSIGLKDIKNESKTGNYEIVGFSKVNNTQFIYGTAAHFDTRLIFGNLENSEPKYTLTEWKDKLKDNPIQVCYELATPVETILSTTLTIDQITAIREAGGAIRVVGNDNVEYNVKPDVAMDIVYRKYDFDNATPSSVSESESDL